MGSICSIKGLLGALFHYGLPSLAVAEKTAMQELSMRGGPYTPEEQKNLLDYCQTDVEPLPKLLDKMLPQINLRQALIRGSYMKAVAAMEDVGIPIDTEMLDRLYSKWDNLREGLIEEVDQDFDVFEDGVFKRHKFEAFVQRIGIRWPRTPTGVLSTRESVFKDMARSYPILTPLKDLRHFLGQMRQRGLEIGKDGRNRSSLWPFKTLTGRNAPSSTKFIFSNPKWMRSLIKPTEGHGLAYLDFQGEEFAIVAALSRDQEMTRSYTEGDPYINSAVLCGYAPPGATKESHPEIRAVFKVLTLAMSYGMGVKTMAERLNCSEAKARDFLAAHKETFKDFWRWSDGVINYAKLHGQISTNMGWTFHDTGVKITTIRNFPAQAYGAEILRLACCMILDSGVSAIAPVHDAILIESKLDDLDEDIRIAKEAMEQASEIILGGFRINVGVERVVRYPVAEELLEMARRGELNKSTLAMH